MSIPKKTKAEKIQAKPGDPDRPQKDAFKKSQSNVGHGHVNPREDGVRARCGGPKICSECATDLANKQRDL